MIAINWFEVFFAAQVDVHLERLEGGKQPGSRPSHGYRTVFRRDGEGGRCFHLTPQPPAESNTTIVPIRIGEEPHLGKHLVECGFADRLAAQGFHIRSHHVGAAAFRDFGESVRPNIYTSTQGLRFRCFFFEGDREAARFGLVLNAVSGRRFVLSLEDDVIRRLAIGSRVIPMHAGESGQQDDSASGGSSLFVAQEGTLGILLSSTGEHRREPLAKWTLPGRRDLIRSYVARTEGDQMANRVLMAIQQDDLTFTAERRMNVRLAYDQLKRLQALLRDADLLTFRFPTPGHPLARLSETPLTVSQVDGVSA